MPLLATQKHELIHWRSESWPWGKCAASALLPYKEKSLEQSELWKQPCPSPTTDRWLISALQQEDTHSTPLKHTRCDTLTRAPSLTDRQKTSSPSLLCVCVCTELEITHTPFSNRGNISGLLFDWWRLLRLMRIFLEGVYSKCFQPTSELSAFKILIKT